MSDLKNLMQKRRGKMDWEKLGSTGYQLLLLIIEWGFKVCAVVAGWFALAAGGSLGVRLGTGFTSISYGLRYLFELPGKIQRMSYLVSDYSRMGRDIFEQTYGNKAISRFMGSLNEWIRFLQRINNNLYRHPLLTIAATVIAFLTFYLLARIIRFARQKGRGSWLARIEIRLGNRVFDRRQQGPSEERTRKMRKISDESSNDRFSVKQLFSG